MEKLYGWLAGEGKSAPWIFAVAFFAALALTPVVIAVAQKKGLVAKPKEDRWHKKPTALFGGVAIVAAAVLATIVFLYFNKSLAPKFAGLGVGAIFIFAIGLYDDCCCMRPAAKFIAQLFAACIFGAIFYTQSDYTPALVWLMPFAIVWIIGITNALNLLDNMDGLAAGVATLVAILMAVSAAMTGDTAVAFGALIIAGAGAGFLIFNFNPAKIFMGDCGSMFLGYSLACLTLMGQNSLHRGNLFTALLLPTLVLATPLFDTTFVSIVRLLHGRSISQGGRDHTSHRLVLLGLSERRAVCYLYAITLWFGLIGLWTSTARNLPATIAITVLSVIGLLVFGFFLAEVQTYSQEEYDQARARRREGKTVLTRVIQHKRRVVDALLDFGLIFACWIAAFLLRFEDSKLETYAEPMSRALPFLIACQMGAFFLSGLYRGLWRYVTISDIGTAVRGIVLGTIVAYALITNFISTDKFPEFPRSVFIIYAALLLIASVGMRLGLKALRYHFALKWREGVKRVLIVGAGDAGELAVREMFNNTELQLQPVGFLDDDPGKQRATIHGIRVLGTCEELLDVVGDMAIDEVVIAMPSVGNGAVQSVKDACSSHGINYHEVRGVIL